MLMFFISFLRNPSPCSLRCPSDPPEAAKVRLLAPPASTLANHKYKAQRRFTPLNHKNNKYKNHLLSMRQSTAEVHSAQLQEPQVQETQVQDPQVQNHKYKKHKCKKHKYKKHKYKKHKLFDKTRHSGGPLKRR
jgi:hypothetical protein